MKKILRSSLLLAALAVAFTGCLKDKGFDNHTYGINDPDTQAPGVGFPRGATAKNSYGLNLSTSPQVLDGYVFVNLESGLAAKSDVHVTIMNNTPVLLAAYLAAQVPALPAGSIIPFPTALYSLGSTALTIPAGGRFVETPINFPNTSTLDPNQAYAIGITITTVDGGYKIAQNLKNLFMVFSVKNRLDGIYSISGACLRFGDAALTGNFGPYLRAFATNGPNSVQWLGTVPWANGSGSTLPGGYEPNITVSPVTNLLTNLTNANFAPANLMTAPVVRTDILEGTTQRYNPATKTLYFEFTYTTPGHRLFSFKAVYSGPR